jgi:hypothetical protein
VPASTVVGRRSGGSPASANIVVASDRATAVNPKNLPKEQAAVAYWLSKIPVALEPIAALVSELMPRARPTSWTRR